MMALMRGRMHRVLSLSDGQCRPSREAQSTAYCFTFSANTSVYLWADETYDVSIEHCCMV